MSDGITSTDEITMTNAVIECILSRSAAKYYDPTANLSDDQIRELIRIGTTAPTSFHLQNWRFMAVRSPEPKARLRPICLGSARDHRSSCYLHRLRPVGRFQRNTRVPGTADGSGHHAGKDGAGMGNPRTRSEHLDAEILGRAEHRDFHTARLAALTAGSHGLSYLPRMSDLTLAYRSNISGAHGHHRQSSTC